MEIILQLNWSYFSTLILKNNGVLTAILLEVFVIFISTLLKLYLQFIWSYISILNLKINGVLAVIQVEYFLRV